ncbi:hypothetical protein GCM10023347_30200 [Streptomyces chumphonensis]
MSGTADRLTVRDLRPADLRECGRAGSELHLANVARQLERARLGEVDYLAVCVADGPPVALGGWGTWRSTGGRTPGTSGVRTARRGVTRRCACCRGRSCAEVGGTSRGVHARCAWRVFMTRVALK